MHTYKPKENKSTNVKLVTQYISAGQNLSSCNLIIIFGKHVFFNEIKHSFKWVRQFGTNYIQEYEAKKYICKVGFTLFNLRNFTCCVDKSLLETWLCVGF